MVMHKRQQTSAVSTLLSRFRRYYNSDNLWLRLVMRAAILLVILLVEANQPTTE